jgi:hypothetical protein
MIKLITLLVAGIPALIGGFLALLGRKWAVLTGTLSLFVLLVGVFVACINQLVDALLALATIPAWAVAAIGYGIPGDFALCLASIVSSRICRAAFDLAMEKARAFNTAQ